MSKNSFPLEEKKKSHFQKNILFSFNSKKRMSAIVSAIGWSMLLIVVFYFGLLLVLIGLMNYRSRMGMRATLAAPTLKGYLVGDDNLLRLQTQSKTSSLPNVVYAVLSNGTVPGTNLKFTPPSSLFGFNSNSPVLSYRGYGYVYRPFSPTTVNLGDPKLYNQKVLIKQGYYKVLAGGAIHEGWIYVDETYPTSPVYDYKMYAYFPDQNGYFPLYNPWTKGQYNYFYGDGAAVPPNEMAPVIPSVNLTLWKQLETSLFIIGLYGLK